MRITDPILTLWIDLQTTGGAMEKIKLTDSEVTKIPFADKGKQIDYYDSELDGFGLRVSATGKKYFARASVNGKRVRVMMKSVQLITAKDARKEALRLT